MVCILKIISAGMSIHQVSLLMIKQLFVAWAGGVSRSRKDAILERDMPRYSSLKKSF